MCVCEFVWKAWLTKSNQQHFTFSSSQSRHLITCNALSWPTFTPPKKSSPNLYLAKHLVIMEARVIAVITPPTPLSLLSCPGLWRWRILLCLNTTPTWRMQPSYFLGKSDLGPVFPVFIPAAICYAMPSRSNGIPLWNGAGLESDWSQSILTPAKHFSGSNLLQPDSFGAVHNERQPVLLLMLCPEIWAFIATSSTQHQQKSYSASWKTVLLSFT